MRIAITGGTGTVGREVALALYDRGHEVRVVSRHGPWPVDLTDGSGLASALEGVEAVVEATNGRSRELLVGGTARLLAAEAEAGVRHHVAISIVGIDRAPGRYYALKREQEAVVRSGPVPWTLVRATRFHPLVDAILAKPARFGLVPSGAARLQPIDPREVAQVLADAVEARPARETGELAGPEILTLRDLARQWRRMSRSRALPLHVPAPRPLRQGALTSTTAPRGSTTFAEWLRERHTAPETARFSVVAGAPRRPDRRAAPPR
jgi:uncharacterized protein YbjT (DUF2867 family)